jgi:hypothetical protein
MNFPLDIPLILAALILPVWIILKSKRIVVAVILSSILFWNLLLAACAFVSATDPQYDSFAPGIAVYFGWFMGLVYSIFLAAITLAVRSQRNRKNREL